MTVPRRFGLAVLVTLLGICDLSVFLALTYRHLETLVEFLEVPLMCSQAVALSIWLALGRGSLVLRLAVWLLGIVSLVLVFSGEWFLWHPGPWDEFDWLGYFGGCGGALLAFAAPAMLLLLAVPLAVGRRRRGADKRERLTLGGLLTAVGCLSAALALLVAVPPQRDWALQFLGPAWDFIADPEGLVLILVMPAIDAALGYAALWHARQADSGRLAGCSTILVVPFCLAVLSVAASLLLIGPSKSPILEVVFITGEYVLTLALVSGILQLLIKDEAIAIKRTSERCEGA